MLFEKVHWQKYSLISKKTITAFLLLTAAALNGKCGDVGNIRNPGFEDDSAWEFHKKGEAWNSRYEIKELKSGKRGVLISFPRGTIGTVGDNAGISQNVTLTPEDKGIAFWMKDSYDGPTWGYHFIQLLLDGKVIWEKDVARGSLDWSEGKIDLTPYVKEAKTYQLDLRVYDKSACENFGIDVWIDDIRLLAEVPVPVAEPPVKLPDWFSETMYNEILYVRKPIQEINGKAFIFWDIKYSLASDIESLIPKHVANMKRLGFTDIIYCFGSGNQVGYPTELPYTRRTFGNNDYLKMICEACAKYGMKIWLMGHTGTYHESMCAKDENNKLYLLRGRGIDDFLSPALKDYQARLFEEIVKRYGKYAVIEGWYYDEPFFTSIDFHGAHLAEFRKYCEETFGEVPPEDIGQKFALRSKWNDPDDKWWRRYILFNNKATVDFHRAMIDSLHKNGLKAMIELRPSAALNGWSLGMDTYKMAHIGADCHFLAAGEYCEPAQVYSNAYTGYHLGNTWGYYHTYSFRGKPTANFEATKLLRSYLYGPSDTENTRQFVHNTREWEGAENIAKAAVLTFQNGLMMRLKNSQKEALKEVDLFKDMTSYLDMDMLFTEETALYPKYKVLIAPEYSISGLPAENIQSLKKFVEDGGTLIDIQARISTAREDLTNEKYCSREITGLSLEGKRIPVKEINMDGIRYSLAKPVQAIEVKPEDMDKDLKILAKFENDLPAVVEKKLGNGKVITFLFNIQDIKKGSGKTTLSATADQTVIYVEEKDTDRYWTEYLASMIEANAAAAVKSDGTLRVMNTLKKGNWIGIALYGKDFPCDGTIFVDPEKLGIKSDKYSVFLLSRNHEYLKDPKNDPFWTADDLKKGLKIRIAVNNERDKMIPYIPCRNNKGKKVDMPKEWMDGNWKNGPFFRSYEYEILAIAPVGEVSPEMSQENK